MVFVRDDASKQDIGILQRQLQSDPRVKSVGFTTKEEALVHLEKMLGQPHQTSGGNPLPALLDIELNNAQDAEKLILEIKKSEVFLRLANRPDNPSESLKYGRGEVMSLYASVLRTVCVIVLSILVLVVLILITVTIVLEMSARNKLQEA